MYLRNFNNESQVRVSVSVSLKIYCFIEILFMTLVYLIVCFRVGCQVGAASSGQDYRIFWNQTRETKISV